MKCVLLILLILAGGYGVWWSMEQQDEFKTTIKDRLNLIQEKSQRIAVKRNAEEKADVEEESLSKVIGDVQAKGTEITSAQEKLKELEAAKGSMESLLSASQAEMEEYKLKLAAYGVSSPKEIEEKHATLKSDNEKLKTEVEEKQTITTAQQKKIAGQEKNLAGLYKQQADYRNMVVKNAQTFSVLAVDQQWGFVVVNAGEGSALEPSTVLLVMRDGRNIAKLKVSSIEKRQTIADIIPNSVSSGNAVQPGDTIVIFQPKG